MLFFILKATSLKEENWKNDHRVYFLNLLFQSVVELKQVKYIMDVFIPESVKKRSNLYLLGCYDIHSMFIELYVPADSSHFVSLKDVAFNIKNSTDFHSLSKIKQRGMKNELIYEFFKTNPNYKHIYKERYDYILNDVRTCAKNILTMYKKKKDDYEDEMI